MRLSDKCDVDHTRPDDVDAIRCVYMAVEAYQVMGEMVVYVKREMDCMACHRRFPAAIRVFQCPERTMDQGLLESAYAIAEGLADHLA